MTYRSNYIWINGLRTHYLEAGDSAKETLIMIHDGGFGGSAEFSWSLNIDALASRFHVYCPDVTGFGKTEKVFNFEDPNGFRMRHLRQWLNVLGLERSHFAGNSWGANLLLGLAAQHSDMFKMEKIIVVSPGYGSNAEVRRMTTAYVPDRENMRNLLKIFFYDEKWHNDPYLSMRYNATTQPGAWEAVAAARFGPPGNEKPFKGVAAATDYGAIRNKVLLVGGEFDELASTDVVKGIHEKIKDSEIHIFPRAKHCAQIERSDEFNQLALKFLEA
ncbi:MAG: alpha/beta fold hydrolase [Nitrososphaerales archaeon]